MTGAYKKSRLVIRNACNDEKRKLVESLTTDELQVYKWLKEGFSLKWTAETLQMSYFSMRDMERRICQKLHVRNSREIVRYYAILDNNCATTVNPRDFDNEKKG